MRALPTSSTDDGPRFHSNVPVSELIERNNLAIEASVVSSAPLVAKTVDRVMQETWPIPTEPYGAQGLEPPDPNSRIQLTGVRRLIHEGLEAASRRTKLGEKMQMSPSGLHPTRLEADRVISTFSFDPNLEPCPRNLHRGEVNGTPESVSEMTRSSIGRQVKEQWNAI